MTSVGYIILCNKSYNTSIHILVWFRNMHIYYTSKVTYNKQKIVSLKDHSGRISKNIEVLAFNRFQDTYFYVLKNATGLFVGKVI